MWWKAAVLVACCSCTVIRPGEAAVRRSFGRLAEEARGPGLIVHSPIGVQFVRVPVRTTNLEVTLDLPSREGLNVRADVSILYHIETSKVPEILETVGEEFERSLILPVFRSAVADIAARYYAKDMHSGQRADIEAGILGRMGDLLTPRGIVVESVLMKSIQLPAGLYAAIEDKLEAEQQSQRMAFVLEQERQEAERRRIEAEGIRDSQRIVEDGLSPEILQWRSIEAFERLGSSPGTTVIITDGELPFLLPSPAPAAPAKPTTGAPPR
jgi:prohibitin 1